MMEFEEIKEIIPHRFPFLMIDRVVEFEGGRRIVAIKNITANEIHFLGHFPEEAIMPGSLISEAVAQSAILLLHSPHYKKKGKRFYYLGGMRMRFFSPVVPGDVLRIEVVPVKILSKSGIVKGKVKVEERTVCEGEMMFSIKNRASLK